MLSVNSIAMNCPRLVCRADSLQYPGVSRYFIWEEGQIEPKEVWRDILLKESSLSKRNSKAKLLK
jgi:hypothetical protein